MNRQGSITIHDEKGRERERYQVVYGARLLIEDGADVPAGTTIAEWDPFAIPILTEVGGVIVPSRKVSPSMKNLMT